MQTLFAMSLSSSGLHGACFPRRRWSIIALWCSATSVWIALAAFAVVTAIAAPMYVTGPWDEFTPIFGGTVNVVHPTLIQTYWLISLPAAYLGYGAYMTWVANHVGVREDIALPAITGLVIYGIVVVVAVLFPESLATVFGGGLTLRGLLPLFGPPVALFVWGALARNAVLLATSVVALAAALVSNLYNLENLLQPRGWDVPPEHALTVNAAFTALVLFVCSLIVGVVEIRRGRKSLIYYTRLPPSMTASTRRPDSGYLPSPLTLNLSNSVTYKELSI